MVQKLSPYGVIGHASSSKTAIWSDAPNECAKHWEEFPPFVNRGGGNPARATRHCKREAYLRGRERA